jgi:AcrR family transcriptional regulator
MDNSGTRKNTEQKILDAATKIFLKKGLYGTRMQEIADEAGINKALLHYYFRNKDKLFRAIFEQTFHSFYPMIVQIFNSDDPIEEKIRHLSNKYIDFLSLHPYLPLFLLNEINRNPQEHLPVKEILREVKKSRFMQQFDEHVKSGRFLQIKPEQFLTNLFALILFPFINKAMLVAGFSMDEKKFDDFISERKKIVPEMVLRAITKSSKNKYS